MYEVGNQKPQFAQGRSSAALTAFKVVGAILGSALVGSVIVTVTNDWSVPASEALSTRAWAGSVASIIILDALPLLETGVIVSAFAIGLVGVSAAIFGLHFASFITLARRFRWRMVAAGFCLVLAVQLGALIAIVGLAAPTDPFVQLPNWPYAIAFCVIALLFYVPAVLGEEVLFRGWLMRIIKRPFIVQFMFVMASATVFSFAHLQWDASSFAMRFASGLAYAWSAIRLGGLELAFGAHLAKNASLVWLIGPPGEHRWEGNDYEVSGAIVFATSIALVALVEVLVRRGAAAERRAPSVGS